MAVVNNHEVHPLLKQVGRPLTESEAPALHATLERLAREAGLAKPELYICEPHKLSRHPVFASFTYNAFALTEGKPALAVGPKLLEHLTGDASGRSMSKEMEAIIGHELGHLKYDCGKYQRYFASPVHAPLMGAMAATIGLAIYRYYYEHPEERHQLKASIENDPMLRELGTEKAHPYMHQAMITGQYLAAGGLGLIAGVGTARTVRHIMEFRADRTAAELMKDGQPMANALRSIMQVPDYIREEVKALRQEGYRHQGMDENAQKSFEWMMQQIGRITHPNTQKRIETVESMRF